MYKVLFFLLIFIIVSDVFTMKTPRPAPLPIDVNIKYTFSNDELYFILASNKDQDTHTVTYSGLMHNDYDDELDNPTYLFDGQREKYSIININVQESVYQEYLSNFRLVKMNDIIDEIKNMEKQHTTINSFNAVMVATNLGGRIVLDAWFVSSIKRLINKRFDFNSLKKASGDARLKQSFLQSFSQPKQPKLRWNQVIFNYILLIWSYITFW